MKLLDSEIKNSLYSSHKVILNVSQLHFHTQKILHF